MDLTGQPAVELTVDHVTVDGLGRRDQAALRSAIERHLRSLVRDRGLPVGSPGDRSDVVIDLPWDGRGGDDALARALAVHIHRALSR
jgi:hypothetical protein